MRSSHRAPCELSGHVVTIRLISDAATATMSINEVQLAHTPLIRRIICPFIATLVNEGVLHGCVHTREKLFEVARASGLSGDLTLAHIKGNFLHNPSGVQDVCDMESAPMSTISVLASMTVRRTSAISLCNMKVSLAWLKIFLRTVNFLHHARLSGMLHSCHQGLGTTQIQVFQGGSAGRS